MAPRTLHHALAVALPAQGHMNPMMRFCTKLAREGVMVTFVEVDIVHDRLEQMQQDSEGQKSQATAAEAGGCSSRSGDDDDEDAGEHGRKVEAEIRRARVPIEGFDLSRGFAVTAEELFESQKSITPHLQIHLISTHIHSSSPFTFIVSDVFMTAPTQPVADSFKLPRVALYPSSASFLLFYSYLIDGPLSTQDVLEVLTKGSKTKLEVFARELDGLPSSLTNADLPHFKHIADNNLYMYNFIVCEITEAFKKAHSIVVNSFHELEGAALETLFARVKPTMYSIGPLVEPLKERNNTSLWKEDEACMLWLDKHPPLSVLYVSFGSVTLLSISQFQEILEGLVSYEQSFLWVVRPDLIRDSSSGIELEELMSKAKGRGYFVQWAPQVQILSHPSIGGFLTHCGWNSTIEAISLGVPMLCWPYITDQAFNARYVTDVWEIGLRFTMDERTGLVIKDEIERVITSLMKGEQGKVLRENVTKLKEASCNTVIPGGKSHKDLHALLSSL